MSTKKKIAIGGINGRMGRASAKLLSNLTILSLSAPLPNPVPNTPAATWVPFMDPTLRASLYTKISKL